MEHPPPITKQQIDALTRFLVPFSVHYTETNLPSESRRLIPVDSRTVDAFRCVYRVVCFDVGPYQPLPEDALDVPQGPALFHHFATVSAMNTATPNQIRRLFMLCTRGEHWGTPWTEDLIRSGVAYAALRRLLALRHTAPDDPASFSEEHISFSYDTVRERKRAERMHTNAAASGAKPTQNDETPSDRGED